MVFVPLTKSVHADEDTGGHFTSPKYHFVSSTNTSALKL